MTRSRNVTPNAEQAAGEEAEAPDELVVLLIRTAKAIVDEIRGDRPAEASAMTPVHGLAARFLLGRDDVTTVELARYLGITKQSASEVVALLEKTGTVRRAPHPSDGRARVLLLTDDGKDRLEQGRTRWQHVETEWEGIVGRERLDVVRGVLEDILAADLVARDRRIPVDQPGGQNSSCVAS